MFLTQHLQYFLPHLRIGEDKYTAGCKYQPSRPVFTADKAPDVHERSEYSVHVAGGGVGGHAGSWRNGGQHIII